MSDSHAHLNTLSLEKRSLFVMRMRQARREASQSQTIRKKEDSHNSTVSFAQQRLWFLNQLQPDSCYYNVPAAMRLRGRLKQEALEQSFQEIIRRHEALRTSFSNVDGEPRQVIAAQSDFALQLIDLGELALEARQA